ncbi:hypothetical protein CYLTODRAFT_315614, partial [Cylindrobasidium torrendii FP15055 ss-10]
YLGMILDSGSRWREQAADAIRKGEEWMTQMARVSKPSGGISREALRRAYLGQAVPRM